MVDEHLDLAPIRAAYTDGRDTPPCDPRLLFGVLFYGYTTGVRSSRVIECKCVDDACFRWLAAGAVPDYRAIARFRRRHLAALAQLFVQALVLCQAAGVLRLGRVAVDGTRVRANVLAEEVPTLLADAERIDKAEDALEQAAQRPAGGGDDDGAAGEGAGIGGKAIAKSKAQRALVGALCWR